MAQIIEGDNHGISRGFISNIPRLPPKFPVNRGPSVSDVEVASYSSPINGNRMGSSHQNKGNPASHSTEFRENLFWLNELLEDSQGISNKRGSHRRSASDSFTYLENPRSLYRFSNIAEEDESECNADTACVNPVNEDGDQLTDLLDEIQQLQDQQNLPISARTQSTSSMCDSSNTNKTNVVRNTLGNSQDQLNFGPECDTVTNGEFFLHGGVMGGSPSMPNHDEGSLDPKQTKR